MAFEVRGPLVPDVDTREELIALKAENTPESWMWRRLFIGQRMQHSYYLWHELNNQFLNNKHIEKIVEIGTGTGALTVLFGLFGLLINAEVLTLDIDKSLSKRIHPIFDKLDVETLWRDENSIETRGRIRKFIGGKPCYIFCDGGDKVKELRYWSRHIVPGSLISVHDWGTEVFPEDVPNEGLEPYREDYWNVMNIQTATWTKTQ